MKAAQLDARMFHESTQTNKQLFDRLCPPDKSGQREFVPIMKKRLLKLGIHKDDPNTLTEEEVGRYFQTRESRSTL